MRISARTTNIPEFKRGMNALQKKVYDTGPLMKLLGQTTHNWIMRNARSAGALLKGRRWPPLAPSTRAARRRGSGKPLMDTGHMMRQWSWRTTRTQAIIGNPMDIAEYHQEGTGLYGPARRGYIIKPVKAKALRFVTGGYTIGLHGKALKRSPRDYTFAKYVKHPGIRQRRMLPTEGEIMPDLIKAINSWAAKMGIRP
jgi:phage gpG-like protein